MKKNIILYILLVYCFPGRAQLYDTKDFSLPGVDSSRELSVAVDPNFHKSLLVSAWNDKKQNNYLYPGGWYKNYQNALVSTNAGNTWQGLPQSVIRYSTYGGQPPFGPYWLTPVTDPVVMIGTDGVYRVTGQSNGGGVGVAMVNSNNQGGRWTHSTTLSNFEGYGLSDKNHAWIDNAENSPYKGTIYFAATPGGACNNVMFNYSKDGGLTWLNNDGAINRPRFIPGFNTCFVNISTGKDGQVYLVGAGSNNLGFIKSADGGANFSTPAQIPLGNGLNVAGFFINDILACNIGGGSYIISNPVILADISDNPSNSNTFSNLYVVFGARNNAGGYNTYFVKSTDDGANWTSPLPINASLPAGKADFMPWATIDPETGALSVIYYSNRNYSAGCQFDVYASSSADGGNTWTEIKLNDFPFDLSSSAYLKERLAGRYGEYNGIAAGNGLVYPVWMDTRNQLMKLYTSPYVVPACDPAWPSNTTVTTDLSETKKAKARNILTATNIVSGDAKVKYVAGNFIELNPGFTADAGSYNNNSNYFTAYINQGCETPQPVNKFSVNVNTPVCNGSTIYLAAESIAGAAYTWSGPNGFTSTQQNPQIANAAGIHEGTYTCMATLPGSGTRTASVQVSVSVKPNKVFLKSSTGESNAACITSNPFPITLEAEYNSTETPECLWMYSSTLTGNFSYILCNTASPAAAANPGNITSSKKLIIPNINYPGSGFYKCRIMNNGCYTETPVFVIYPAALTVYQTGSFCFGGVTVEVNQLENFGSNAAVSWSGPNGYSSTATSIFLSAANQNAAGTYTCTVTTATGCTFQHNFTIYDCGGRVAPAVNPAEVKPLALKVFPNPTSGLFFVEASAPLEKATLVVTDASGKTVYTQTLAGKNAKYTIQLPSGLTAGLYIVTVRHSGGQSSTRLLVSASLGSGEVEDEEKDTSLFLRKTILKEKQ